MTLVLTQTGKSACSTVMPSVHPGYYEIEFDRGCPLRLTASHKQFIFDVTGLHEVEVSSLKEGDYVPYNLGYYKEKLVSADRTSKFYFLGLAYGSGLQEHPDYPERICQQISFPSTDLFNVCDQSNWFEFKSSEDHSWIYKKEIYDLAHLIFPDYKSGSHNLHYLTIPQLIDFIAGWFDFAGKFYYSQPGTESVLSVESKFTNHNVVEFVSIVLSSLGMINSLSKKTTESDDCSTILLCIKDSESQSCFLEYVGFANKSEVKAEISSNDSYRSVPSPVGQYLNSKGVTTSDQECTKFLEGICDMPIKQFLKEFSTIEDPLIDLVKQGYQFAKITSIKYVEKQSKCFDIIDTDDHTYILGDKLTHNCNYVTDYKGLLAQWMQMYPKVTFINMRMEELGRDVDALHMMKFVGSNRISAPMEGMSPRIQNNLLNKCLSTESLTNFMDDMVHAHLTDIKVGGIFTCFEEDQDFQWMCDFVDSYKKRAEKEGGNFPFRLKCCLTKDALTPVEGEGLVRQNRFALNSTLGGTAGVITKLLPQGLCDIVEVDTQSGFSVKGTLEHPLLIDPNNPTDPKSFVFMKDLHPGDIVYAMLGTDCYGDYKAITLGEESLQECREGKAAELMLNEQFAEILGWFCGSNYVDFKAKHKLALYYSSQELDVLAKHQAYLESLGFTANVKESGSVQKLEVNDTALMKALYSQAWCDSKKGVPELILQSPKSVQQAFIRGCFSSDGSCKYYAGKSFRMRLCMCDKQFIEDVQVMLMNIGIFSTISGPHSSGRQKPMYKLYIIRREQDKFVDEVGFVGCKSFEYCDKGKYETQSYQEINGFVPLTVKSVKFLSFHEETYGLTVTNGIYVTNGLVSHNTPLVHYNLTPLEYVERRSARNSYEGKRWLTDEWYDKFREHQVFFKVNGFRYSTFLEQSFIDMGRYMTPLIYKHFIKKLAPIYSLRSVATDEFLNDLKAQIKNPDVYFGDRHPAHYISPSHRIHIELMGSYVARARRLVECKQNGDIFDNPEDIRCLKTFEGAKVKCYSNAISKEPLKIYDDVELDENGNLHGKCRLLLGCERCKTPEQRKWRLTRSMPQSANLDSIRAIPRLRQSQRLRFVLRRLPEYEILNPGNTSVTFITKLLQNSDNLLNKYHSMFNHNMFWSSETIMSYYVSGLQLVDTLWQEDVYEEVKSLIPVINSELKSVQVVDVFHVLSDDKILITDYNICSFRTTLPKDLLLNANSVKYEGNIRVVGGGMGEVLESIQDKSLRKPIIKISGNEVVGVFSTQCKYNPVEHLLGWIQGAKKISLNTLLESTEISCEMVVRKTSGVCSHCNNETRLISIATGRSLALGFSCLEKVILSKR